MGSNAIISVLGFIIVFSIVTATLNKRNKESYQNTYGYVEYTVARDIARNSIQVALRKIDTISSVTRLPAAFPVTGVLQGGTFQVDGVVTPGDTLLGTPDSLRLTAQSFFNDSIYTIRTLLTRQQLPLPPSLRKGAFGIYPDSVNVTWNGSNDSINGLDHDLVGNVLPASADTVPPFLVRTAMDSSGVVAGVTTNGSKPLYMNLLIGNPKIMVYPVISNPNAGSDQFKSIADTIVYSPVGNEVTIGKGNGDNIGDSTHPVVAFFDGTDGATGLTDGKFKLSIKDGWGILVVKGGLNFASGATWHGVIIEYGNIPLTFDASAGGSTIIGGILFGGTNNGTYKMGGNSKVLHSKAAFDLFKKINNPSIYQIVDWYE